MKKLSLIWLLLSAVTVAVCGLWAASEPSGGKVPAYNARPPAKDARLPPILAADQLKGNDGQFPYQIHAYELAGKIPAVLHQQPCYCYCDRVGHNSLRTCFESDHAARCGTCLKELYYAYLQSQKGRSAAQVRKGIIAGEWQEIDLRTAASMH